MSAENLDHYFYERRSEGSFGRKSFRSDTVTRVTQQGTEIETGGDLTLVSGSDQLHQASQLTSGADLTLSSGGSVVFEGVLDLHQESHEKSKSSWAWQSAKGQGNTDQTLIQSQLQAQGELIIRAAEGVQIDVREIHQQTVSQTIDAMVAAEPGLAWLKEMEVRGDVDWRHVKEVHDSFSYSHSGLGAGAQLVIAIVVAAMVGPGASALAGGGTAGAVTGAVATSAATNAVVSTVNNRGDLGAVFDDITSSDAVKGYVVAGATAGLTAGVYDNLLGTKTNPVTGQVVVDLSTVEGVGRFAANQALQGTTSTALYRALGEDSDFSQVLGNALVNTFAAYGFNLVGDLGDRYQLPSGSAEKVVLHALMGGLAAEAYGGDFASGALVAGVNELVVADLNAQFAGLPDDQREALLVMNAQLLGVLTAALQNPDGDVEQLEIGSSIARNAVQYNHELHEARAASFAEGAIDLCKQRPDICPAGSQSVTQEELVEALQVIAAHGEGMEVVDPQAMALASHVLTLFGSTSETLFTPTESEQARIDSIETAEWILAVGSAVGTTAAVARNVLTAGPGKLTSWFSGLMGRSGDDVVGGQIDCRFRVTYLLISMLVSKGSTLEGIIILRRGVAISMMASIQLSF
ncbi:DUF637 domain-containing protein [Halopseudomonas maritima]|uniref:DUF637 domain-containing protein n=1 Tax=Halopseudomonas maritima TaxID=2918528 RepID=UPI0023B23E89|nr:DUF637 domain-containing protein [Halopseudomonas maritima]